MSFSNQDDYSGVNMNVTMVVLALIVLIGSLGNAIVIWVYGHRRDGQTSTFFIIVLAIVDLQICILVVPFTMAMEILSFQLNYDFICKSYYFLNTSNTLFSCLLISAVALDRYLCICHPMHRILPVCRAKILVCSLAAFSMFLGVLAAINVKVLVKREDSISSSSTNASSSPVAEEQQNLVHVCDEIVYHNSSKPHQKIFFYIVQRSNHVIFISCIILVIIFYSFIYSVVLKVRKKTKTLLVGQGTMRCGSPPLLSGSSDNHNPSPPFLKAGTEQQTTGEKTTASDSNGMELLPESGQGGQCGRGNPDPPPQQHAPSKSIRESELFQNVRSAAMLFVVAIVYILVFTPALLMANGLVPMNLIVYYFYYFNSASNPIIYCFMNSDFRSKLKKLIIRNNYQQGHNYSRKQPTSSHHNL